MKATLWCWWTIVWVDLLVIAFLSAHWVWWLFAGGWCAVALAVVIVAHRRQGRVSEAAGWSLGEALELSNPDNPRLVPQARIPASTLRYGLLALGAPGAGKTESVLLGALASLRGYAPGAGMAVFEGKGDIDIYKKCVAMGRKPDWFFSTELEGSHTINLMDGQSEDVLDRLVRLLIGHTVSTSYYSDVQRAVLAAVVPLLKGLGEPVNLRDLYTTLSVPEAGVELLRRARDAKVDPTVVQLAEQWFSQKPAVRKNEIHGLLNKLFVFCHGPHTDRLNAYQADIVIDEVVANNQVIYCHLPLSHFSKDVAIALVEMFGVVARRRQLAGPENATVFPLLLDDWGDFFHENFGAISARCRSAAMPLFFSFQSLAQVKKVSPTFADELDDNLATKIILRTQGEETSGFAMRLLDEYEAMELSASSMGSERDNREGTQLGISRRYRLTRRDLRELLPGEAFISTLYRTPKRMVNPLWRVRMPLADIARWREVAMPEARAHQVGQGLCLWQRYMDPDFLNQFALDDQALHDHRLSQVVEL